MFAWYETMNMNTPCLDFQRDARAGLEVPHGVGVVRHHAPVGPQQLLRTDFPQVHYFKARHLLYGVRYRVFCQERVVYSPFVVDK